MRFWPVDEFKFWEGDRLIAHYTPGMSYQLRPENERLKVLLLGGPLPGTQSVFMEQGDFTTEYKPGDEVPGWLNTGTMTLLAPEGADGGGTVGGSAVVGKEG